MSTAQRTPKAQIYNEMHGLLVQVGKHYCDKKDPKCNLCPLGPLLPSPKRFRTSSDRVGRLGR